ncbi:MAG: hypothetical protein QOE24_2768 [Frankiales bacterium]|nr:hypothetical protein [Frankiales bacterium]
MPDLSELLAAEVRRMEAPVAPDFDTLVVRARRRRRHQVVGAVLGVVALVAAAVVGPSLVRADNARVAPSSVTPSATALPVSPGVYARLRQLALSMAKGNGDDHPTQLEAVAVTDARAADGVMSDSVSSGDPVTPGYVVEVRGNFVCRACSTPFGGRQITGTVVEATVRAGTFTSVGFGMGERWTDLHKLGTPFSLATPATAAPVAPLPDTQTPAAGVSVAPSSGPAAPDPKTLAEAESRTRQATLDPTRATVEVAAKSTAGQLRIAGLVIPAKVSDPTEMFVVVVNGSPIFPAGVGKDGRRVTKFAIVFNTDGSGLGAQAVYHGAFGLPDAKPAPTPLARVVDATKLSSGGISGWEPAPTSARASAIPVSAAVAAARPPSLAKPLAALVYVTTLQVTRRLAWIVQADCVPAFASTPLANVHPNVLLETQQVLVDATTGKVLESATFGP